MLLAQRLQYGVSALMVVFRHHHTTGQNANGAFHHTHMAIKHQCLNALFAQAVFDKGDQHHVIGAKQLGHVLFL